MKRVILSTNAAEDLAEIFNSTRFRMQLDADMRRVEEIVRTGYVDRLVPNPSGGYLIGLPSIILLLDSTEEDDLYVIWTIRERPMRRKF